MEHVYLPLQVVMSWTYRKKELLKKILSLNTFSYLHPSRYCLFLLHVNLVFCFIYVHNQSYNSLSFLHSFYSFWQKQHFLDSLRPSTFSSTQYFFSLSYTVNWPCHPKPQVILTNDAVGWNGRKWVKRNASEPTSKQLSRPIYNPDLPGSSNVTSYACDYKKSCAYCCGDAPWCTIHAYMYGTEHGINIGWCTF